MIIYLKTSDLSICGVLTFWEPSDITKKSSTSAPVYWLIFIHRYSIFPVRIFLDHPPGGPGHRSWPYLFCDCSRKEDALLHFRHFCYRAASTESYVWLLQTLLLIPPCCVFLPLHVFFSSPLRFVSSHDKVLRVQLAEAPAWVHAGRRLLWQIWWGKTFSHALESLKFVLYTFTTFFFSLKKHNASGTSSQARKMHISDRTSWHFPMKWFTFINLDRIGLCHELCGFVSAFVDRRVFSSIPLSSFTHNDHLRVSH